MWFSVFSLLILVVSSVLNGVFINTKNVTTEFRFDYKLKSNNEYKTNNVCWQLFQTSCNIAIQQLGLCVAGGKRYLKKWLVQPI